MQVDLLPLGARALLGLPAGELGGAAAALAPPDVVRAWHLLERAWPVPNVQDTEPVAA